MSNATATRRAGRRAPQLLPSPSATAVEEFSIVPRLAPPVPPSAALAGLCSPPAEPWRPGRLAAPRDKCGSREFKSVAMDNGETARRERARPGRFCGWEVWHADPRPGALKF